MTQPKQVLFKDQPGVKIKAKLTENHTSRATQYNCEGDLVWIPHSVSSFNYDEGTLVIAEWFYKKLQADGKL